MKTYRINIPIICGIERIKLVIKVKLKYIRRSVDFSRKSSNKPENHPVNREIKTTEIDIIIVLKNPI
jgi:hypothetical protein